MTAQKWDKCDMDNPPWDMCGVDCPPWDMCGIDCPPWDMCGMDCPPWHKCDMHCPPWQKCGMDCPPWVKCDRGRLKIKINYVSFKYPLYFSIHKDPISTCMTRHTKVTCYQNVD